MKYKKREKKKKNPFGKNKRESIQPVISMSWVWVNTFSHGIKLPIHADIFY